MTPTPIARLQHPRIPLLPVGLRLRRQHRLPRQRLRQPVRPRPLLQLQRLGRQVVRLSRLRQDLRRRCPPQPRHRLLRAQVLHLQQAPQRLRLQRHLRRPRRPHPLLAQLPGLRLPLLRGQLRRQPQGRLRLDWPLRLCNYVPSNQTDPNRPHCPLRRLRQLQLHQVQGKGPTSAPRLARPHRPGPQHLQSQPNLRHQALLRPRRPRLQRQQPLQLQLHHPPPTSAASAPPAPPATSTPFLTSRSTPRSTTASSTASASSPPDSTSTTKSSATTQAAKSSSTNASSTNLPTARAYATTSPANANRCSCVCP